jgi:enterochelin esterase family protein
MSMLKRLRVEDPELRYAAVRLCSDLPLPDPDFVRCDGGWVLELPDLGLARLEYQLEVRDGVGNVQVVCDPDNPERAPGAFGEKSVVLAPGYRPPGWLGQRSIAGSVTDVDVRLLDRRLTIRVWSATEEDETPLLIAHDGPEYDRLALLTHWAGTMIARRTLPPFRIALVPPGDRDEWYSASAIYARALCLRLLPALREAVPTFGRPIGIGASLGALAMLHAQRTWPETLGGLFLQSGSFFMDRFDRHESGFRRYARITRFVRGVLRTGSSPHPVPVVMTCGSEEENIHNNRVMAAALAAGGYPATLHEVPDMHNYTSWRDALDPHLTRLLQSVLTEP